MHAVDVHTAGNSAETVREPMCCKFTGSGAAAGHPLRCDAVFLQTVAVSAARPRLPGSCVVGAEGGGSRAEKL